MPTQASPGTVQLSEYQPPAYWVEATHLTVRIYDDETRVSTCLVMRPNRRDWEQPQPLVLHANELSLTSLMLNDEILELPLNTGERLYLPPVNADSFELRTEVVIYPGSNTALEGLYRSGGMYCTQCEPQGFRRITPYPDRPDVLSVFTTRIEADDNYPILLANGNLVDQGTLAGGRHFTEWHDPFPKPSYLFALVAGDLHMETDHFRTQSGRDVSLQLYTERHNAHKTRFALESLKRAMRWDEARFGREYDLDRFMIVAVDHFNMGAMENKGLNIFNSACVLADEASTTDAGFETIESIVAHEYFHNWSGNRVTCRDWFQLSLKEGLTVFRDSEFTADMHARTVKRIDDVTLLRTAQFAEDAGPMAHPVRPSEYMEINNFYTLTVYEKGAEIVRMLSTLAGPELFRQALDLYFERFDGQAVTTEDFVACLQEVTGIDLAQFQRWYDYAGTPRVQVRGNYNPAERTYSLSFRQSCPPTPGQPDKPAFHIPVRLGLVGRDTGAEQKLTTQHPGFDATTGVFSLRSAEESLVFENRDQPVVPSLFRDFSAPVICSFPYSEADLQVLIADDDNHFNRWDAMQQLMTRAVLADVQAQTDADALFQQLVRAMTSVLTDTDLTPAVKARLLRLPTQGFLAEQYRPVDPLQLDAVLNRIRQALGKQLTGHWTETYARTGATQSYQFLAEQNGQRALHLCALDYRVAAAESGADDAHALFLEADNMTEKAGALAVWSARPDTRWTQCMEQFLETWQNDAQVVEKWLGIKASAHGMSVQNIRELTEHAQFDWTNPNRIRSVIGGFAMRNPAAFHRADGSGYAYLTEVILHLDRTNPQIAARLCAPLTHWQRYTPSVQERMTACLERIRDTDDLTAGVYEVVSKSLAEQKVDQREQQGLVQ